jgi:hypothetical protein
MSGGAKTVPSIWKRQLGNLVHIATSEIQCCNELKLKKKRSK